MRHNSIQISSNFSHLFQYSVSQKAEWNNAQTVMPSAVSVVPKALADAEK